MVKNHQSLYDLIIKESYRRKSLTHIFEIENDKKYEISGNALFDNISLLEVEALSHLKKKNSILDIGAGSGRLSVYLQLLGHEVAALEKSKIICRILRKRGLDKVINADIFNYYPKEKYDVVLLVHVYSIFGKTKKNITKLFKFLNKRILCNKKSKAIFILSEANPSKTEIVRRRFIFKNKTGPWFESIFPSSSDLIKISMANGFLVEKLKKNKQLQYYLIIKKVD